MHRHIFSATIVLFIAVVLGGCAHTEITERFASSGITRVVLRAANADSLRVASGEPTDSIEISGLPTGDARGYHPADPNWRETPAEKWGFDFVAQRHGSTLVISTKGEIGYIHHYYVLEDLRMRVPGGVEVVRQPRVLDGDGKPDLSEPWSPKNRRAFGSDLSRRRPRSVARCGIRISGIAHSTPGANYHG